MARTALVISRLASEAGLADPAGVAPDGSNGNIVCPPKLEGLVLRIKNTSGDAVVLTVAAGPSPPCDSGVPDATFSIGAGATKFVGPFSSRKYSQQSNLWLDWSATSGVTVTPFYIDPV